MNSKIIEKPLFFPRFFQSFKVRPWKPLGTPWEALGAPWKALGTPWKALGTPWKLRRVWLNHRKRTPEKKNHRNNLGSATPERKKYFTKRGVDITCGIATRRPASSNPQKSCCDVSA